MSDSVRRSKRHLQTELAEPDVVSVHFVLHVRKLTFQPVNFSHIEVNTLKKYKRFYSLRAKHSGRGNEDDLYDAVVKHFATLPAPPEDTTIDSFIFNVKNSE